MVGDPPSPVLSLGPIKYGYDQKMIAKDVLILIFMYAVIADDRKKQTFGDRRPSFKIHVLINRKYRKAMIAHGLRHKRIRVY